MKKIWKVLAATAAVASVIPVFSESDEKGGMLEALLWKAKWTRDPNYESKPEVDISIGFHNPFKKMSQLNQEDHLFADELMVDYCCDNTLVHDCAQGEDCESEESPVSETVADTAAAEPETADTADTSANGKTADSETAVTAPESPVAPKITPAP